MTRHDAPSAADYVAAGLVGAFTMAMVVEPPPNLDLWWLLAVGKRIVETRAYIYHDPFTFTSPGAAWSPQSYASAILFYLLHAAGGMALLTALRVALAGVIAALTFRAVRMAGASWVLTAPLVLLAMLTAQTRLADRGQMFEYAFLAWLAGFLLAPPARGKSFFIVPAVVQLAWVQFHSSFLLGPAVVGLFFAGEWVSERVPFLQPLRRREGRRGLLLALVMAAICAVNPSPRAFLVQPFDPVQHELISRFTLEWKSPFDPAIASANFHPYYEILLAVAALSVALAARRLSLGPAALMAATAFLSLQSHRFRVEFALVAVPMVAALVGSSPVPRWLGAQRRLPRWALPAAALAVLALLGVRERDRLTTRGDASEFTPDAAFDFVAENDVAKRAFHPIGFGSYMLWDLYGRRQTFIDGRNFDAGVHRDFVLAQSNPAGLRAVIDRHRIDAFILPATPRADAGMRRIHDAIVSAGDRWSLVHMDAVAFVYVANATVDSAWLDAHAYRAYHPLTFAARAHSPEEFDRAAAELERVTSEAPGFSAPWMDLGLVRFTRGDYPGACDAFEQATVIDPDNAVAWNQLGHAARAAGLFERAVAAYSETTRIAPANPAGFVNLARAYASSGDSKRAMGALDRALALDPHNGDALELRRALTGDGGG